MTKTDFLKLNLAELELITGWFSNYTSTVDRLRSVAERFKISKVVVTMGGEGAILFIDGNIFSHPGFSVTVKDTVGSGDAFLAGLLSKMMDNKPPGEALEFANGLGAFIATKTGACPQYNLAEVLEMIEQKQFKTN
jgi:fructokinase